MQSVNVALEKEHQRSRERASTKQAHGERRDPASPLMQDCGDRSLPASNTGGPTSQGKPAFTQPLPPAAALNPVQLAASAAACLLQLGALQPEAPQSPHQRRLPAQSEWAKISLAARNGDLPALKQLYETSLDIVLAKDTSGSTLLHQASVRGHLDLIKYLVSIGCDNVARDVNGSAPVHLAATNGRIAAVQYFLHEAQCDREIRDNNACTPLHLASFHGHLELARYLVSAGCSTEARNNNGNTVLHFAAIRGHLEVVKYFVSIGCDTEAKDNAGLTSLSLASKKKEAAAVVDFLQRLKTPLSSEHVRCT